MAKEVIPPTPIPVGDDNLRIEDDQYCLSHMKNSDKSLSETSTTLLNHLASRYINPLNSPNVSAFIAEQTSIDEVTSSVLDEHIPGITKNTLSQHLLFTEYDTDVLIFAILY